MVRSIRPASPHPVEHPGTFLRPAVAAGRDDRPGGRQARQGRALGQYYALPGEDPPAAVRPGHAEDRRGPPADRGDHRLQRRPGARRQAVVVRGDHAARRGAEARPRLGHRSSAGSAGSASSWAGPRRASSTASASSRSTPATPTRSPGWSATTTAGTTRPAPRRCSNDVLANPRLDKNAAGRLVAEFELGKLYAGKLQQIDKAADAFARVVDAPRREGREQALAGRPAADPRRRRGRGLPGVRPRLPPGQAVRPGGQGVRARARLRARRPPAPPAPRPDPPEGQQGRTRPSPRSSGSSSASRTSSKATSCSPRS